jgi:hypothetical protein
MPPDTPSSSQALLEAVEPIIQSIVRKKLFVTLRRSDFREQNQDALDVLSEIRVKLLQRFAQPEPDDNARAMEDFRGYGAAVAFHSCADYLRAKHPERTSLKNNLRRLLQKVDGYATWTGPDGDLLAGFVGWQNQSFQPQPGKIAELNSNPKAIPALNLLHTPIDQLTLGDWTALLDSVFEQVEGPLPLDELVGITGKVLGVSELFDASRFETEEQGEVETVDTLPSPEPDPHALRLHQERLQLYWAAVQQLLPWHRAAYLLNLRSDELESLAYYAVATVQQIGDALELKSSQLEAIWSELLWEEADHYAKTAPRTMPEGLAILWRHIPLEDNLIAKMLGVTRPQVIAYRKKAKERLARNLKCLR